MRRQEQPAASSPFSCLLAQESPLLSGPLVWAVLAGLRSKLPGRDGLLGSERWCLCFHSTEAEVGEHLSDTVDWVLISFLSDWHEMINTNSADNISLAWLILKRS